MHKVIIFQIVFYCTIMLQAQSWTFHSWEIPNNNQSLIEPMNDYFIDSNLVVWSTSTAGLCAYDLVQDRNLTCYRGTNNQFYSENSQVEYANNRFWILSKNGFSSYDGNQFVSYTTANGLIDNNITDIEVDNQGDLWLASLSGVSHFNGTAFIHDTGIVAHQIAIDSLNRVFVVGTSTLFDSSALVANNSIYIKVGNTWQIKKLTGLAEPGNGGAVIRYKDIYSSQGQIIVLTEDYIGGYYSLSYPAQIDSHKLYVESINESLLYDVQDLQIDQNGRKWIVAGLHNDKLYSGFDSILSPQYVNLYKDKPSQQFYRHPFKNVRIRGSHVVAYTAGGYYSSTINAAMNTPVHEELAINSIKTQASVLGPLFHSNKKASFEFPKGNNTHGIYSANLMLSAKKKGEQYYKVNQADPYKNRFNIGAISNTDGLAGSWIEKVSQQEINDHIDNYASVAYVVPDNILNWRGNGDTTLGMAEQLAPYEDRNKNGVYEPILGDYPKIKGDEAIFWINNIGDLEYHGMLYGYDRPIDSALNQTLFLQYEIYNRSNEIYDAIKAGVYVDFDLGNGSDDYMGCDSLSNTFFAYNGDSLDEASVGSNGFGSEIPLIGLQFLSDSMMAYSQFSSALITNNFIYPSLINDHWHNLLNSAWLNSAHVTYGGNGINSTGTSTNYMYTGVGSGWSEDTPGFGLSRNPPGDRVGLGTIPYFSLQPGESKMIEVAIGYAFKANGGRLGSKDKLINLLDSANRFWKNNVAIGIKENTNQKELSLFELFPNPTNNYLILQSNSSSEQVQFVQFYSIAGNLVKQIRLSQRRQTIDISDLEKGLYFVRVGNGVKKLIVQ